MSTRGRRTQIKSTRASGKITIDLGRNVRRESLVIAAEESPALIEPVDIGWSLGLVESGWFEDLSEKQQATYIKQHPRSKYAKEAAKKAEETVEDSPEATVEEETVEEIPVDEETVNNADELTEETIVDETPADQNVETEQQPEENVEETPEETPTEENTGDENADTESEEDTEEVSNAVQKVEPDLDDEDEAEVEADLNNSESDGKALRKYFNRFMQGMARAAMFGSLVVPGGAVLYGLSEKYLEDLKSDKPTSLTALYQHTKDWFVANHKAIKEAAKRAAEVREQHLEEARRRREEQEQNNATN